MERNIYDFFDDQTMSADCAQRIEAALKTQSVSNRRIGVRLCRAVIAAAILVCLSILTVCGATTVQEGKSQVLETLHLGPRSVYKRLFGLETRSRAEIEAQETENKAWEKRQMQALQTPDPLAEVRDGRLYFIACGENIDITDLCSPEKVFLYTYTDDQGFLHYIGIGGTPKNWGNSEVIFDPLNPNSPSGGWSGGGGHGHWDNEADKPYGWYVQFKELTGHPYPL